MTSIEAKASSPPSPTAASWWPLAAAPFAGLIYYLAICLAFEIAIDNVFPGTGGLRATGWLPPRWGAHWIYHIFAEAVSITFGTFIAGGLARERAPIAGSIGGLGISLLMAREVILGAFGDPWYESMIIAGAALAAPIVGYSIGGATAEISTGQPGGFAGIPRAHFLWLWIPTYWYGVGIISLCIRFVFNYIYTFSFGHLDFWEVYTFPLTVYAIPLFVGLALMTGHIENLPYRSKPMKPVLRQTLGAIVLIIGWCVAIVVETGFTGAAK